MTYILDMSSGKEYTDEEFGCQQQRTEKSQQLHIDRDADQPTLQLEMVESTTTHQQLAGSAPALHIDALLASLED